MAKKNALGSALGELLGEVQSAYEKNLGAYTESVIELSVDMIKPNPFQPRKRFDAEALNNLAESIAEHGLLQPILVYDEGGEYFLIAGERRLRASKIAEKSTIKAVLANDHVDKSKLRELAIIENIQRENLNPIDLAHSYYELIEDYKITHEELAKRLKKSRAQITNTMRILELCDYVQELIAQHKLTQGHAKVMVGLDEKEQIMLADSAIGQKLSVREIEQLAKNMKRTNGGKTRSASMAKHSISKDVLQALQVAFTALGIQSKMTSDKMIIQLKNDTAARLLDKLQY